MTAAIITKINVTLISEVTTVMIVSVTINQTLTVAMTDPTQSKTQTLVSSRAILP